MPRDWSPQVRAAGVAPKDNVSLHVGDCMVERTPPPTPERLRPFRRSHVAPLGGTSPSSSAAARDAKRDESLVYGSPTKSSITAADCLVSPPKAVANPNNRPHVYTSERLEPLGRGRQYPFELPPDVLQRCFGKIEEKSESAKNIIYPSLAGEGHESPQREPGYQGDRHYNWTVNPLFHRFGKPNPPTNLGSHLESPRKSTVILPSPTKIIREERSQADVGKQHRSGCAPAEAYAPGRVFGKVDLTRGDSSATLLQQRMSVASGKDVGEFVYASPKLRKLKTEERKTHDSDRIFGASSIRGCDAPPPHKLKVSSGVSYQNGAHVAELLYGGDSSEVGSHTLSVAECGTLASRCGITLTSGELAHVYACAQSLQSPTKPTTGGHSPSKGPAPVTATTFARAVTECGF